VIDSSSSQSVKTAAPPAPPPPPPSPTSSSSPPSRTGSGSGAPSYDASFSSHLAAAGPSTPPGAPTTSPGWSPTTQPLATGSTPGGAALDPASEIARLNSDGDRVMMTVTGEGKIAALVPEAGVQLGVKGQYGYQIAVQQKGGAQPNGQLPADGKPPQYEVTFSKRLQGGGTVDDPTGTAGAELSLRTADTVMMRFNTPAEATQAVASLQRMAAAETIRDGGRSVPFGPMPLIPPLPGSSSDAVRNPLADAPGGSAPSLLQPGSLLAEPIANRVGPSQGEEKFLRDHISGYAQTLTAKERVKFSGKIGDLGIEPRLDANQSLTRTVELPRGGAPGKLTYTLTGDVSPNTKEKLNLAGANLDVFDIGYSAQNIVDHGYVRGSVSVSYALPPGDVTRSGGGRPVPEIDVYDARGFGHPSEVSARLDVAYQTQGPLDLTRTDQRRMSMEAKTQNPAAHSSQVVNDLMSGDLDRAFAGMGSDFTVSAKDENVVRHGFNQQHEIGAKVKDLGEIKGSVLLDIGRDDITAQRMRTLDGTQIAQVRRGGTPAQPASAHEQFVVTPQIGLNVRPQPSTRGKPLGVLHHGTFVEATGEQRSDARGRRWMKVAGPDVNNRPVEGWVAADNLRAHPKGAMNNEGRINPELEAKGYRSHAVKEGDTLWDIAHRDGANFQDLLKLNGDHLIDPSLVFKGDRVYLPNTGRGVPSPAPAQPAPPVAPSAPFGSAPSGATSPSPPAVPSGRAPSPGTSPSSHTGSDDPLSTGSISGANPAPGIPPDGNQAAAVGRPDLGQVLKDYQTSDDRMVQWAPSVLFGSVRLSAPRDVTATEAKMLEGLSINGWVDMRSATDSAFSTSAARYPAPDAQPTHLPQPISGPQDFREWVNNDGHRDAFRHAYWNALMTKSFGAQFTEHFTTAHEGVPGNPADREAMDLYNNSVGRRIATQNPNASESELADLVQAAVDRGEMIVLDRNGALTWSDRVPLWQHGQTNRQPAGAAGALPAPDPNARPQGY
jgi:Bacterial SH3 domain/LysM domain